jgi:ribosomal protein S18 acetylase RimI-like enzyme
MKIIKLEQNDKSLLELFKGEEWPEADGEHYGSHDLNFARYADTLIAKDEDRIIGYISFFIELGVAHIDSVIVGKKFRRKGMAEKLINEVEVQAKSLGAHKIRLETGVDWKARFLYEKLGYNIRAILPNYYGNKDFILMDKEL